MEAPLALAASFAWTAVCPAEARSSVALPTVAGPPSVRVALISARMVPCPAPALRAAIVEDMAATRRTARRNAAAGNRVEAPCCAAIPPAAGPPGANARPPSARMLGGNALALRLVPAEETAAIPPPVLRSAEPAPLAAEPSCPVAAPAAVEPPVVNAPIASASTRWFNALGHRTAPAGLPRVAGVSVNRSAAASSAATMRMTAASSGVSRALHAYVEKCVQMRVSPVGARRPVVRLAARTMHAVAPAPPAAHISSSHVLGR